MDNEPEIQEEIDYRIFLTPTFKLTKKSKLLTNIIHCVNITVETVCPICYAKITNEDFSNHIQTHPVPLPSSKPTHSGSDCKENQSKKKKTLENSKDHKLRIIRSSRIRKMSKTKRDAVITKEKCPQRLTKNSLKTSETKRGRIIKASHEEIKRDIMKNSSFSYPSISSWENTPYSSRLALISKQIFKDPELLSTPLPILPVTSSTPPQVHILQNSEPQIEVTSDLKSLPILEETLTNLSQDGSQSSELTQEDIIDVYDDFASSCSGTSSDKRKTIKKEEEATNEHYNELTNAVPKKTESYGKIALLQKSIRKKLYQCSRCNNVYNKSKDTFNCLKRHGFNMCKICFEVVHASKMKVHAISAGHYNLSTGEWKCAFCDTYFSASNLLKMHIADGHLYQPINDKSCEKSRKNCQRNKLSEEISESSSTLNEENLSNDFSESRP